MFKKLLITVVVLLFLGTAALAALPSTDSEQYASDKLPSTETAQYVSNDMLYKMYYSLFGEGFEVIQSRSAAINQTASYGNWQLELMSAVAIATERTSMQYILPDNIINRFDNETGTWQMFDRATGEIILLEEFEQAEYTTVRVYIFFSLQDMSGEIDLSGGLLPDLIKKVSSTSGIDRYSILWNGGAFDLIYFDEESGTAYFATGQTTFIRTEELGESISVDFIINSILAGLRGTIDEVNIDFVYLLENHEAALISNRKYRSRSGGHNPEFAGEVMGEDFSPFAPDTEFMAIGELNIPIAGDIYLSNIDLRGNMLFLQTSRQDNEFSYNIQESSFDANLIDTRVERIVWEELWADVDTTNEEAVAKIFEQLDLLPNRHIFSIYIVDVTPLDEYNQPIGYRRYIEEAYYLENHGRFIKTFS